ncbi:OmpA family protein [Pseudoalteromonas sp. MMG010]|uniref:flagellar motor protein MotB n=1 Tax=Pseudoalteromonas sp. MMG010 TaxID=2822685 RepID=UPI001B39F6E1|nr:flagellar motor protein MotB [Pseudoalteromonas sp. MMG010]MBQ4831764.1 OmpA family protein [Pseudoalteromonas sp. MMG010]
MLRKRIARKTATNHNTERWLVSYADYMTILFAFFVVMYSLAITKEESFQILSDSLEQVFDKSAREQQQEGTGVTGTGVLSDRVTSEPELLYGESIEKVDKGNDLLDSQNDTSLVQKENLGTPLESVMVKLQSALLDEIRNGQASLELNQDWLIIELSSGMLFTSGSATAHSGTKRVVNLVYNIIADVKNYIRVRGYTDNETINNEIFKSNWELSVARATSILIELEKLGITSARMAIEGYGQYSPFADNATAKGRSENRKVVIALSKFALPDDAFEETAQELESELPVEIEKVLLTDDKTIKIIHLEHGGIRITTRNEQ